MHRVLGIVAVHLYLVAVELYEVQNPKGVVQSQARLMKHALQSSTAAVSMHRVIGVVAVHLYLVAVELYEIHNLLGVIAVTSKADVNMPCRAALLQRACTGSWTLLLCICTWLL